ncbi:pentapeptide repeat-containing protein [Pyxidicoccus parkwayensis]|uniref:Pentapeptide repeat-containing protein n=1 Tax=Pyxidicoccus parkwayensis TaxID=2813578 RepID=A0ABX7P495_9BACT|nr:pentapeptide repeat-containing protein [Pyxidicoccus parkwaysis]QSQ25312.1 pentapeptide repeat-containing protein [Pyxidicoccus parkwaysis]
MRADVLAARWNTPDGQRRRAQLIDSGLRGAWRELLAGFPGTELLGDNLGDLRGIDLTQEELPGADLVRARLDGAQLDDCGLQDARLELATLSGASLRQARMERANLTACVALDACWDDAFLEGAVLTASNLTRASFRRAHLRDARFDRASLFKADLRNADLRDTGLFLCDLEDALLTCATFDPPRAYPYRHRSFVREARRAGYPSFVDPIMMLLGFGGLLALTNRNDLKHIEAGVEASSDLDSELVALLKERNWRTVMVVAAAVVLGGANARTLSALWEVVDQGNWAHPQLTVALLLRDADFENQARARTKSGSSGRSDTRACLEWALHLRTTATRLEKPDQRGKAIHAHRWLVALREQVDARIQAQWHYTPPAPE